jgi:hypothetical protein
MTLNAIVSTSSQETATGNNADTVRITHTSVADLAVELIGDDTDVSNLGGRGYAVVRVTNVGTAAVSDVRVIGLYPGSAHTGGHHGPRHPGDVPRRHGG